MAHIGWTEVTTKRKAQEKRRESKVKGEQSEGRAKVKGEEERRERKEEGEGSRSGTRWGEWMSGLCTIDVFTQHSAYRMCRWSWPAGRI